VRNQLSQMEDELTLALEDSENELSVTQRRVIQTLLRERSREWFEGHWGDWLRYHGEPDRLEQGMACLSEYLGPAALRGAGRLTEQLDELADNCREHGADESPAVLVAYLFGEGGSFVANSEDFYDPRNFNLSWVIENGKGNHLSLACLVVMVGRRLGIKIDACDYPGRFMARYVEGREIWLVDAYHGGVLIPGVEVTEQRPVAAAEVREIIARPATARTTLRRALEELETALLRKGYPLDATAVRNCLQSMLVR
jgi:regulator of sirC expression with transglutaminase-like and TPR domain